MMNISLVFPPFFLSSMYNLPPLGLINLATSLKDSPHQVRVVDLVLAIRQGTLKMGGNMYDNCADIILEQDPDIVGFSAQCTTYPAILQISKRLKHTKSAIQIVLGGHNASFLDTETLDAFSSVDVIISGEGEITFREWVTCCDEMRQPIGIPGITWRNGRHIIRNEPRELISDLDTLPLPDYSLLPPFSAYRDACQLPRSIAILEVGRGCPHRCIYCSESLMWRRKTRTFSVSRLVEEMETLHIRFGAECFLLAYDQFTANRSFVEAFCHLVIQKGINHIPWYCISRLDSVDAPLLQLMREAGCESMCYGIDSGSRKTLSFIRKQIRPNILYERVVETATQGIIPTLSFVVGFPEEEREDIDQTLTLALRAGIAGNNNPLIQMPTVLPGTDLHKRYGNALIRVVDTYFALGLEFDEGRRLETDENLINAHPFIFSSFYNLPCRGVPLEELGRITSYFPYMVQLYPRSFLILAIEYALSVSDLFSDWLKWLQHRKKEPLMELTPQDTYAYFNSFVKDLMKKKGPPTRRYLFDLLRYETIAISVAKASFQQKPIHIDIHRAKALKPLKQSKIRVESFDFDLPVIIFDLKKGIFNASYTPKKTVLTFLQEDDTLDVLEINDFLTDFLTNCDGDATLEEISHKLHPLFGKGLNAEAFFANCLEALQNLNENNMIQSV